MLGFDWNLIASFLAVLDHGSLASAARENGISQPSLGRHIDELETVLGVTLFHRGRGGMKPTDTALDLAESAKAMQAASDELSRLATGASQSVEGVVRITASEIVANYVLPSILGPLLQEMPEVEIELAPSNTVENLLQRDADIAVRMVRPTQNDLIARKVGEFKMGCYADQNYLDQYGAPTSFENLKDHIVVGYDRNDLIIRGFAEAGYHVDRSFFRFRCDNQIVALEALAAGVGVGFAPQLVASKMPNLVRVLEGIAITALPMWLVTHCELRTSRRIRLVHDRLGKALMAFL